MIVARHIERKQNFEDFYKNPYIKAWQIFFDTPN